MSYPGAPTEERFIGDDGLVYVLEEKSDWDKAWPGRAVRTGGFERSSLLGKAGFATVLDPAGTIHFYLPPGPDRPEYLKQILELGLRPANKEDAS